MVEATIRQQNRQIGSSVAPTETELADAAFLETIERGDRDGALVLLKKGQQINVADERGETAVHKATKRGLTTFVAELIKYGAVPDHADMDGVTPVMIAVQFGNAELVAVFISLGERVNFANVTRDGATLLHTGAYYGHEEIIRTLLTIKPVSSLIEAIDTNGRTPLQIAAFRSSRDICALLVSAGADFAVRDKRGNDCSTLATKLGRRKSHDFFQELIASAVAHTGALNAAPAPAPE
jgi:hypothetical protein